MVYMLSITKYNILYEVYICLMLSALKTIGNLSENAYDDRRRYGRPRTTIYVIIYAHTPAVYYCARRECS